MSDHANITKCLVLAAPGAARDGLRDRLSMHGWNPVFFDDPCLAMAELCLEERSHASRTGWGLPDGERTPLIIAAPDRDDDLERVRALLGAVRRYLPGASVLGAADDGFRPLTAPTPATPGAPETPAGSATPPHDNADDAPDAVADDPPQIEVTAAEMEMLFSRQPEGRP